MKTTKDKLLITLNRLIEEGREATTTHSFTNQRGDYVGVQPHYFAKWQTGCQIFLRMLGEHGEPWAGVFKAPADDSEEGNHTQAQIMLGTLRALGDAICDGLLITVEGLVIAEAFDDLLEQAEHLEAKGYHLPAGVVGRAVLEEHLRKWCQRAGCMPTGDRPVISDFYSALFKAQQIDGLKQKLLIAMTDVGNKAAHNKPDFKPEQVECFLREVRSFVTNHPLN